MASYEGPYLPIEQNLHSALPLTSLYFPGTHILQSATDTAPGESFCLPNSQSMHVLSLNAATAGENLPRAQSTQADAFTPGLNLPLAQSRQCDSEGAPSCPLNLPTGHRPSQDAVAFSEEKNPAGHFMQADDEAEFISALK